MTMLRRLCSFLALCCLVLNQGCFDAEKATDVARKQGILLVGNRTEPQSLDPHVMQGNIEHNIISSLIEGLVIPHPTDYSQVQPAMAERWEHNKGFTEWTFYIRKNALWSNGDPVRAADFVYAYNRILSPNRGARHADDLFILENAEAYHDGSLADFAEVGVKALDEKTLQFRLNRPVPHLLSLLHAFTWWPVHPPTIEKFGAFDSPITKWTLPGNYVGNGPFVLQRWDMHQVIEVSKNPRYWDADQVKLQGIHFLPIEQPDAEGRAFRAGQLHLTYTLPVDKITIYQQQYPEQWVLEEQLAVYYYSLNVNKPSMQKPRVRQALSLAIDRDAIVNNILKGGQLPATGLVPAGVKNYATAQAVEYNPSRARALLAAAGYPQGKGFPEIEILINTGTGHRTVAVAIQQMWEQELGIKASIVNQEWKVYLDSINQKDYIVARGGWIGLYNHPLAFLDSLQSDNGNNHTNWSSTDYDALVERSQFLPTIEEQYQTLAQAEAILLEAMPVIPIYWYVRIYAKAPEVKALYTTPSEYRLWKYAHF